jgi:outer membrane protein OmpA-like peptidoglycan-associated protein
VKAAFITGIVLLLVVFQPSASDATGIYQLHYRYSFDGIARDNTHQQTFVISENACEALPYLARAPRLPALSVRVTQDVTVTGENAQKRPDGTSDKAIAKKDTSERQSGPDARITILFDLNSSTLSNVETAKLSSFIDRMGPETKGKFLVTGYTCDLGKKAHNDILAKKRAEAVATYLRRAGMRPSRITGTGKCCYATKDADKRSLNRRVEVRTGKGEATQ